MSERRLLLASGVYIDLSEYLLKSEAETLYAPLDAILNKQDKLISGTNIKTINNQNILGSGNITISFTEQYKGTITGVSVNGTSIATSGIANIPAASTSAYGVTKLSSATNSTSTTLAATASAVKAAYDLANSYKGTVTSVKINGTTKNPSSGVVDLGTVITAHQDIRGKQDKLVSGTNIKTINGTSLLGSGDIVISGGSSSGGNVEAITYSHEELFDRPVRDAKDLTTGELVYFTGDARYIMADGGILADVLDDIRSLIGASASAYPKIYHDSSETEMAILPNQFHIWDEVSELTVYPIPENTGYAEEFLFQFTSGSTPTTLTIPDGINWADSVNTTIEANKVYQISILNGVGSVLSCSNY